MVAYNFYSQGQSLIIPDSLKEKQIVSEFKEEINTYIEKLNIKIKKLINI